MPPLVFLVKRPKNSSRDTTTFLTLFETLWGPMVTPMMFDLTHVLLGGRAIGAPYGKTQEWWPPPSR